jgi:hypothetical protein
VEVISKKLTEIDLKAVHDINDPKPEPVQDPPVESKEDFQNQMIDDESDDEEDE